MKGYYYYTVYLDEYMGFAPLKRAETLQNALKGLRKYLFDKYAESGVILNSPDVPNHLVKRTPKNLVGVMNVRTGKKKIKIKVYDRTIQTYDNEYIYIRKGERKQYKVLYDGRLVRE